MAHIPFQEGEAVPHGADQNVAGVQNLSATAFVEAEHRLIPQCLFPDGKAENLSHSVRIALTRLLRQIVAQQGEYGVPKSALQHPEFPGNREAWNEAAKTGIFVETPNGYLVTPALVKALETAVGKTRIAAGALDQNTRPSGGDLLTR